MSDELLGVKFPVPVLDHKAVLAPPPKDPAMATAAPLHEFLSGPAFTVGGLLQVVQVTTVIVEVSELVQPAVDV